MLGQYLLTTSKQHLIFSGDLIVKNQRTGDECMLTFKLKHSGWFSASHDDKLGIIIGTVKDASGSLKFELNGRWTESLTGKSIDPTFPFPSFDLWKRNKTPPNSKEFFTFTSFTMGLNQFPDDLKKCLPCTDSRFRPDQKAMERGLWDNADELKRHLENKQRSTKNRLKQEFELTGIACGPKENNAMPIGEEWWIPRWFQRDVDPDTNEEYWNFTHEYWKHRTSAETDPKAWPAFVLDIFGILETT